MSKFNAFKLLASIILCLLAGFLGSLANITSLDTWFDSLVKPSFNPPNWVFQPVWTTLFVLMGVALYLVWSSKHWLKFTGMLLFFGQLVLNIMWSVCFFAIRMPMLAFFDIVLLWGGILLTMLIFRKISRPAFWLLVPYILWVSFAAALNLAFVLVN